MRRAFSLRYRNDQSAGSSRRRSFTWQQETSGSSSHEDDDAAADTTARFSQPIHTFLGKSTDAIVRPGIVLVAPAYEFHHFYRESAIFVYAMGEDENDYYVIRGVILDQPTPFTLSEMLTAVPSENSLGDSLLFRGGDKGGDGAILLHNCPDVPGEGIGSSGVWHGGWEAALQACRSGSAQAENFKAFFNYCEFTEKELEKMLDQEDEETGDGWMSVEVDNKLVLNGDWGKGECWRLLRNALVQLEEK